MLQCHASAPVFRSSPRRKEFNELLFQMCCADRCYRCDDRNLDSCKAPVLVELEVQALIQEAVLNSPLLGKAAWRSQNQGRMQVGEPGLRPSWKLLDFEQGLLICISHVNIILWLLLRLLLLLRVSKVKLLSCLLEWKFLHQLTVPCSWQQQNQSRVWALLSDPCRCSQIKDFTLVCLSDPIESIPCQG